MILYDSKKTENLPYDFLRDPDGLNFRYYQLEAVEAVEKAVIDGAKHILLAMATGTGKTRTILGMVYRFLKTNRTTRIWVKLSASLSAIRFIR